jgi:hypothetical protein
MINNNRYFDFVRKYQIPILLLYLIVDYYITPLDVVFLPFLIKK